MPKIKVSDFIFKFLHKNSAKHIFLVPGGGNMHLTDAVKRNKNLEYTNFFHEQSAAIAAESYSRSNNNLGVALVTSGPGATNAITGAVGAWIESVPMIIISGQVKTQDLIKKSKIRQNGPQEVEIVKLINGVTKFSITVKSPKSVISILKKALSEAISKRSGPVWIDIPLDIQAAEIHFSKKDIIKIKKQKNNQFLGYKKIIKSINNSKSPIILAGHGIRLSNSKDQFLNLVKKLQIPVLTTWNSIDLIDYNNRLNIGSPGVVARRYSNIIVQKSDLIISLGSSLNKIVVAFNEKDFGRNAKKIIVDIDKYQLKKINIPRSYKINACCNDFITDFNLFFKKKIKLKKFKDWIDETQALKKLYSNEFLFNNNKNLDHYYFTNKLSKVLKPGQLISTGSSGLGIEILYTHFQTKKNQRIYLTSGLGSMGYGLPSAIGNCLSNNKKKTILIESDGSFMFNIQELATIRSYNLPIKIIILNNKGYASIRTTHKNYFNERFVGTGFEDGIRYPNFEIIAKAFNFNYFSLKKKLNFEKKFQNFLKNNKPTIIEVFLNKNDTLKPKVSSIIKKNGQMISMPLEDMSPLISITKLKNILNGKLNKNSKKLRNLK